MSDKDKIPGPIEAAAGARDEASVSERIDSLREKAENGELGDEFLEEVSGGTLPCHTDGITHTDGAHSDGVTHTDCMSQT